MLRLRLTPLLALALALGFAGPLLADSATKAASAPALAPLLPTDFAGWHLSSPQQPSTQPQTADEANTDVLKEDGFSRFSAGTYTAATRL
jgi:hypothetical protein